MQIPFYKYQGTGNDFILIDNRDLILPNLSQAIIEQWCNRKFGIGADGLMLLQKKEGFDFEMVYYNSDGNLGSMCGNGGRCITAFAHFLGVLTTPKAYFYAADGPHHALLNGTDYVELKMGDVSSVAYSPNSIFLDTGSPHHIEFVQQINDIDVYNQGRAIRYNDHYRATGTNVNFVEVTQENQLTVATYERGVENETLSCGTGVTAAALAYHLEFSLNSPTHPINIQTKGGQLTVRFQYKDQQFYDIWLCGPAIQVFKGHIKL
ncbi:diaminopimelate epimerase [Aureispira anguillae]|uniref:Diaminopimelate epimerase n=1 Tax=Aureispira anguillae TaxID=2864201 RepID=A0A915YFZ5_9BACT|nr:diaminopimelate epimerase [Aureispira anguillae]BDS12455.1 diaminopimelate epimerase [Aureispira anguillae]